MAPVNLQERGWTVHRGQALWLPKAGAQELAGTILIASSDSGEDFIHFSKGPLEIVLARRNGDAWMIDIPAFEKSYGGRGNAPRRIGWFQLANSVNHQPTSHDWHWSGVVDGRWNLSNARTGERLEGFFAP